jgi:hypothetical protein
MWGMFKSVSSTFNTIVWGTEQAPQGKAQLLIFLFIRTVPREPETAPQGTKPIHFR